MPHYVSGISDELISRARTGDSKAYDAIVLAYVVDLVRFASIMLKNRDGAEDVVQEVFLQVWMRRESLPATDRLGPYLYRAIRNRVIDTIRAETTRKRYYTQLAAEPGYGTSHADVMTARNEMEETNETSGILETAVNALTERQRMVLMLRYEQGLTHAQVAEVLGISLRAAEQLAKRALIVLRSQIGS